MNLHDFFMFHAMLDADRIHRQMHQQNEETNRLRWPKKKKYIDNTPDEPYSIPYKESEKLIKSREAYETMNPKPDLPKNIRNGLSYMDDETQKIQGRISTFRFYHLAKALIIPVGILIFAFLIGLLMSI